MNIKNAEDRQVHTTQVCLTPEMYQQLKDIATVCNMSLSTFFKTAAIFYINTVLRGEADD